MNITTIKRHFILIQDKRQSAKIDYPLFDILFGALCAVIAGAVVGLTFVMYVLGHHAWFRQQQLFEQCVPVDDTFAHLISTIKPHYFREYFLNWMRSVHRLIQGEVVATDGKTLRGSYNREDRRSTIHMNSAYACANQLVLGQMKTDGRCFLNQPSDRNFPSPQW